MGFIPNFKEVDLINCTLVAVFSSLISARGFLLFVFQNLFILHSDLFLMCVRKFFSTVFLYRSVSLPDSLGSQ